MALADLIPAENRSPGLTASELERAQEEAGAAFPPDLLELLGDCLPVWGPFPDWRKNAARAMSNWRNQVLEGFIFDVEQNGVWPKTWGARPDDAGERRARVAEILDDAPRLIPIYMHRGIPNEPLEAGNPIFSVMQMDIVIYGNDLQQYLRKEFVNPLFVSEGQRIRLGGGPLGVVREVREIRFWTAMLGAWD